jgi:PncC family amidohydrolase
MQEYNQAILHIMETGLEEPLEILVGKLLKEKGLTLATAESCTGGLIGSRITDISGSSDYYLGGVVAYANQTKMQLLGVLPETLAAYGAVSEQTVIEMARGARRATGAQIGVSVSGIAGPGGAMPGKPVGLVWLGLSAPGSEWARRCQFSGDRVQNKAASAEAALRLVVDFLKGELHASH